jgi:hypothetical protein
VPSWVADAAAGFGHALSFGLTSKFNDWTGASAVVDPCSGAYQAGQWAGLGVAAGAGAAGLARAAAARSAGQATTTAVAGRITGYTQHGLNQAISRAGGGVSPQAILNAVRNPQQVVAQANGTVKYVGQQATVVLNQAGKVVTTWARSKLGIRGGL